MSASTLPDYAAGTQVLTQAALAVNLAELQGLLTGMLVAGLDVKQLDWQLLLQDYTNEGLGWPQSALTLAQSLINVAHDELTSDGFSFTLSLDHDSDLFAYADSVSDWVNHFISGLGLSQMISMQTLSTQAKEVLGDLEEIAKLGIDEDDDLNEQALILEQVVEHIKVCVLTLFLELRKQPSKAKVIH